VFRAFRARLAVSNSAGCAIFRAVFTLSNSSSSILSSIVFVSTSLSASISALDRSTSVLALDIVIYIGVAPSSYLIIGIGTSGLGLISKMSTSLSRTTFLT
jgi:hypothetical protein